MKKGLIILGEENSKISKGLQQHSNPRWILAHSDVIKSQGLTGSNISAIENYYKRSPHIFSFRTKAADLVKYLVNEINNKFPNFGIEKVSPLQVYAGALTIYYFDKALFSLQLAQTILKDMDADEVILDTDQTTLARAIIFEARKQKINIQILNKTYYSLRSSCLKLLWMMKEITLSLFPQNSHWKHKSDVMFICSVPYHHAKMVPIITQLLLSTRYSIAVVLGCELPTEQRIKHIRVKYLNWQDIRGAEYAKILLVNLMRLKKLWAKDIVPSIESILAPKIDAPDGFFSWVMDSWFKTHIFRSVRSIVAAKLAINRLCPKIIISIDSCDPNPKAFEMISAQKQIQFLCLPFGFFSKEVDTHWCHWGKGFIGVMGQTTAEIVGELTLAPDLITVVGDASYDSFKPSAKKRQQVRRRLNIPKSNPMVAYMSFPVHSDDIGRTDGQFSERVHKEIIESVVDISKQFNSIYTVIKPHPVESIDRFEKVLPNDKLGRVQVVADCSAYDLLNAADIVITVFSMTGFEAILLDKPLIVLNWGEGPDIIDYVSRGAACSAANREEMYFNLKKMLEDKDYNNQFDKPRQEFLQSHYCFPYYKSAERCVALINTILCQKEVVRSE